MTRPTLWLNDPLAADLLRRTGWPALYDITDDWLLADRSPREHDRLVESERYLLDHCRHVVVCSPRLLQTKSPGRAERVTLVPNAVDVDAYQAEAPRPTDLPRGPVVLYVGTLHRDRLDVDLSAELAQGLRGAATFVLVGPVALDTADQTLLTDAGAVLLGAREHVTIPAYLKNADVLVVPHVVTDFTDSLDPIKVYEYLAAGRPVVSTPVAGFRELDRAHATVVESADLPAAVSKALTDTPATATLATVPSWGERALSMREVIDGIRAFEARG
jgi:glycosyltransferase involved in cell wall biosynthesis